MGVFLQVPVSLKYVWNFGSLILIRFLIQLMRGVYIRLYYFAYEGVRYNSFHSILLINDLWLVQFLHRNGASLIFVFMYLHIGRGIFYKSYLRSVSVWVRGVSIFLLSIMTAFVGYVLPLNQIAFWAANVIINLFSEIPVFGVNLVIIMWGGRSVNHFTIVRFFSLHYLLPFVIFFLVFLHLMFLHRRGSGRPKGGTKERFRFGIYFILQDFLGASLMIRGFFFLLLFKPIIFIDYEAFLGVDYFVTPKHIQPEWYFLFAYTILRSVPRKIGGVIGMFRSVLILYFLSLRRGRSPFRIIKRVFRVYVFWWIVVVVLVLTWIGARPAEDPYIFVGQLARILYFGYFVTIIRFSGILKV